jgi:hypothetical protein
MIQPAQSITSWKTVHEQLAWTRHQLGASVMSDDADNVVDAGQQPSRCYHTLAHFESIAGAWEEHPLLGDFRAALRLRHAQEWHVVQALMMRAGLHHDVVYLNADNHRLPARLASSLHHFVEMDADGSVVTTRDALPDSASPQEQQVFMWAQALFEKHAHVRSATNEYLSAVYAGLQGLREGIAAPLVLAEMLLIAATVPFQPSEYITTLASRLESAYHAFGIATDELPLGLHSIMTAAVQVANYDVIGFATPHVQDFHAETQLLLQEASGGSISSAARQHNHQLMQRLAAGLQPHTLQIFCSYQGYPSAHTLESLHARAQEVIAHSIQEALL